MGGAALVLALTVIGPSWASAAPAPAGAQAPAGGARPVAGGPERLPRGTRAEGALPATAALSVDVALRPSDPAALEAFDQAVTTPSSPLFRHFLPPGQFAARFGPSAAVIGATRTWLQSQGLVVGPTAADGLLIPVSGPASAVGRAFGVGFEQDRLASGRTVHQPTSAPLVPAALSGAVQGVVGLDDVNVATPQTARPAPGPPLSPASSGPVAHAGASACGAAQAAGTTAGELTQAYSMSSLEPADEGQGVTVGIYELEPYSTTDIGAFKTCYGITPTVNPVSVDGSAPTSGPGSGESALDIEMVLGLVPRATVDVYVGPNGGSGPLDVFAAMVDDDSAQVLSTSWGECEPAAGTAQIEAEASLFQQAAAQGQSVLAAGGDEGSEDCNVPGFSDDNALEVDDPASQPWVTAVGGTQLGSLGPPPAEAVWNTGLVEGTTGGGNSTQWTMPSWQLGPGVESGFTRADDSYTGASPCPLSSGAGTVSCREVPDVTADGDPNTGYATYWSGGWQLIGGTSMGAPLWASIAALADESVPSPPGRIGLLDPALYQAGCLSTRPFNDVTSGDNEPLGSPPGNPTRNPGRPDYPATAGYDLASGLGSPIAVGHRAGPRHPGERLPVGGGHERELRPVGRGHGRHPDRRQPRRPSTRWTSVPATPAPCWR